MALWLQEQEYDALPLGQYQASRGAYLAAVADDAWQSNPLPSLLRWNERMSADYGQLGGTLRFLAPFLPGGRENFEAGFRALGAPDSAFKPESRWLTIEEVHERGKALGLKAERGMSEAAFESIAEARRRKLEHDAIYQRARLNEGYGPGLAALSVALEFAVSAADPLNAATAFLPLARLPGLAGLVARVPAGGARRLATGAIEGGLGNLAVEPAVALAAVDEDPNYGWTNALLTLAFGVGLGGGLHWLGGRFSDRYARGEPEARPTPRSILETPPRAETPATPAEAPAGGRAAAAAGETPPPLAQALPASTEAAGGPFRRTPQLAAARIEALRPETRAALAETALRQAGTDQAVDVHALAGMDRNWRPIMARAEGPAYRLGGWDEAQIRRELAEQRSILEHLALAREADRAARLKAPAGWEPTPALLKQAKAYVRPPKVAKEPMRLAQMVRAEGGLDIASIEAQNLKAMDLGPLSGLVRTRRKGGVTDLQGAKQQLGKGVDELIDAAMARGFYPQERPDAAKFIADLIEDAQDQRRIYAMGRDQPDIGAYDMTRLERQRWEQGMEAHPLGDPRDLDPKDLAYYLSLDPVERRLAELDDLKARGAISEAESLERVALLDRALADEYDDAIAATARELRRAGLQKKVERYIAAFERVTGETPDETMRAFQERARAAIEAGYRFEIELRGLPRPFSRDGIYDVTISHPSLPEPWRTELEVMNGHMLDGSRGDNAGLRGWAWRRFEIEHPRALDDAKAPVGRPEGFEGDLEGIPDPRDTPPLTLQELDARARDAGPTQEPGGEPAGTAGGPGGAGLGQERGAAGAVRQPAASEVAGAVSRTGPDARQEGGLTGEAFGFAQPQQLAATFDRREFDLWLQRQGDWRADAHASPAAAARADAIIAERQAVTPERDLAELEASVGKLLDEAGKEELKAVSDAHAEARAMVDAFAACRMGARDGG